jgi:hypothetical protein
VFDQAEEDAMGRNVLVDVANVLTNVNNGHEPLAKTLKQMRDGGVTFYYDDQGYREAVTNNPRQMEGEANRQTLLDLGFKPAPQGNPEFRADFHTLNMDGASFQKNPDRQSSQRQVMVESKLTCNFSDAALAATAYANKFEILSRDSTFASPGDRQRQLRERFTGEITTRVMDPHDSSAAAGSRVYSHTGRGLLIAPESVSLFGTNPLNPTAISILADEISVFRPIHARAEARRLGPWPLARQVWSRTRTRS